MKNLFIFKIGSTFPDMAERYGDFEEWIASGLQAKRTKVTVLDLLTTGSSLPAYADLGGIVITGSHEMITDRPDWSEGAAKWLPGAVDRRIPILGICYGHQLLAHSLGGEVDNNPKGLEFGTIKISLTEASASDRLFDNLESGFDAHVTHTQSITRLPRGATRLAYSDRDPNQAFAIGDAAWGVQFHPEFNQEITKDYIGAMAEALSSQGDDPDRLMEHCKETPESTSLLKRFCRIVESR